MKLTDEEKRLYMQTAETLSGKDRRVFMARVVTILGRGGQRWAEKEMGWNRGTIRKGLIELENPRLLNGQDIETRGRKPIEYRLPRILADMEEIIRQVCRKDPEFWRSKTVSMSTGEILSKLVDVKAYKPEELPSAETVRRRLRKMGYRFK